VAPPISDAVVVDVLRRVDRGLGPLVARLGRPPELPPEQRAAWWAQQVGQVAAGISAAPRLAGKLADLLPLQNTVGSAVQALVVLGVAGEHGLADPAARVSLMARVLLDRDLTAAQVQPLLQRERGVYVDDALGDKRSGTTGVARSLWRAARLLGRVDDALDARPKGRWRHRALAQLPVVGVVGGYAAEREALRRAARRAADLLSPPVSAPQADQRGRRPGRRAPLASRSSGSW
jgi:hypothetical protein